MLRWRSTATTSTSRRQSGRIFSTFNMLMKALCMPWIQMSFLYKAILFSTTLFLVDCSIFDSPFSMFTNIPDGISNKLHSQLLILQLYMSVYLYCINSTCVYICVPTKPFSNINIICRFLQNKISSNKQIRDQNRPRNSETISSKYKKHNNFSDLT